MSPGREGRPSCTRRANRGPRCKRKFAPRVEPRRPSEVGRRRDFRRASGPADSGRANGSGARMAAARRPNPARPLHPRRVQAMFS